MKKGTVLYFFYTLLMVSLVLFYLWQRFQVTKMGYEVSRLKRDRTKLEERNKYLEMERVDFSSLSRVEKIARERGMVFPQKMKVITIKEDEENESSAEVVSRED